jgi:hypothetical protein
MNKFKKSLFLITLLCIALVIAACSNSGGKDADKEGVMATVNGKPIMQKDYDDALAYYKDYVEYQLGEDAWETETPRGTYKEIYEEYVWDEMTKSLLLLDAAEKEGIKASAGFPRNRQTVTPISFQEGNVSVFALQGP